MSKFKAIATKYRGYEFRSRLEAKYAVFFDQCGWKWSYEPIDLKGWIPDFMLGERRTFVEIKPFFAINQYGEAKQKIRDSGCEEPVILLGADPCWLEGASYCDGPAIGWVYEQHQTYNGKPEWMDFELNFGETEGNGEWGLCPMGAGWTNYIWTAPECSHPNKWSRVFLSPSDIEKELCEKWAFACNVAKWMPVYEEQAA